MSLDDIEAINATRDLARLVRAYYVQLIDEGFGVDEAITLAAAYAAAVITREA